MDRNEKPRKKHKHYHDVRCGNCGAKIDIDLAIELEDYDEVGKDKINVYCPQCGESHLVKL